jgi:hypothetical protein
MDGKVPEIEGKQGNAANQQRYYDSKKWPRSQLLKWLYFHSRSRVFGSDLGSIRRIIERA